MKIVTTPGQLLEAFAELLEGAEYVDLNLQVSSGKHPGLRIVASKKPDRLPIILDLHPSRKILEKEGSSIEGERLILAPHIPGELAKDFRRYRINHADLNGRLYLKTSTLLVDKEPRTPRFRGPDPKTDWFSSKSSRIIRSLLSHPNRDWIQKDLIERTGVSGGLVSRIVNTLETDRFLEKRSEAAKGSPAKYRLKDGARLLDRWEAEDKWEKRVHIEQYSLLMDDASEIADTAQKSLGGEFLAFTQWFAANQRYPFTTTPVVSAYVRREQIRGIKFGRKVESGGNLWLIVPQDEGVFLETRLHNGFRLVSDVQLYLDLIHVGMRGPEHAEALRNWEGFNQ